MAQYKNLFEVDLSGKNAPVMLRSMISEGNAAANIIGAAVFDNCEPVQLNGSCTGRVLRADGNTVALVGTIDGNTAYVTLDSQCYAIPGTIVVIVNWVSGENVTTLVKACGTVERTQSGGIIETETIPNLDELLAQIERMEEVTEAAEEAAERAEEAAEGIEEELDGKLGIADYSAAAAVGTADNLIDRKAQGTTQKWTGIRTSCGSQSIDDDGYAQIRQITGIGVYGGVKATAIKTIGFNAYNNATGTAALLGGNEYQITGAYTALSYSTGEEITPDGDGLFTPTANGVLTVTGGDATTTCVHLTWSGYRNGEYETYWENTLSLPIAQYFPNGMYATCHISDTDTGYQYRTRIDKIESGKVTQWLKIENIKDCTIAKRTAKENQFEVKSGFTGQQIPGSNGVVTYIPCFLNSKGWSAIAYNTMDNANPHDKCISPRIRSNRGCIFEDSDYATYWQNNDIDGLKAAMGDVYVVYTLSSAIVTEIDPPLNLQYKVADFGTEEAVGGTFNGTVAYSSDFTRMVVNNHDHIGTLSDLQTTAKNNLVAAINELAARLATLEGGA